MSRTRPSFSRAFCGADFCLCAAAGAAWCSGRAMGQFCPPWNGSRPALNGMHSASRALTLSDFDFDLPRELIAQHPAAERSSSRLLDGTADVPVDRIFRDEPLALLERFGHVPLPPYITHADSADDERRYQTVFARQPGAVAAPTAALHFDAALLGALAARGVAATNITLHVGAGTFQPVRSENLAEHTMHSEWF